MPNITAFNRQRHHIHLAVFVTTKEGARLKLRAILDTGAPVTELSDQFLHYSGIMELHKEDIVLRPGLETQKYGKITLPYIEICQNKISNMTTFISRFEKSWGVDALIGLDFFRKYRVTVDYSRGHIITEPY